MALLLETAWGDLVIDLDVEGSPELAKNILKLAKARFYTQTLIYSVTPNRFCQGGCPVGDGSGGTSIYGLLDDSAVSADYHNSSRRFLKSTAGRFLTTAECQEKGRVVACLTASIADTIGSQFLITTAAGPDHALDGYSLLQQPSVSSRMNQQQSNETTATTQFLSLGVVTEDENRVLDKINAAYVDDSNGRPYADIRIRRALVIDDPFEDPPGMIQLLERRGVRQMQQQHDHQKEQGDDIVGGSGTDSYGRVIDSPSPVRPAEETVPLRISITDVDEQQFADDQENERALRARQEEEERRETKSRAVVLEMLGDLPDADIQTPENVLFICKLNPSTLDEDLELIFSRFDPAVKVEIIRDHETGASLQYAFAEFTHKQQAVEAFFKMNNALVDDRRIKVDFSQSVSKIWDKYNQRMRVMPRGVGGGNFASEKRPAQQQQRSNAGPGPWRPSNHNRSMHQPNSQSRDYRGRDNRSHHHNDREQTHGTHRPSRTDHDETTKSRRHSNEREQHPQSASLSVRKERDHDRDMDRPSRLSNDDNGASRRERDHDSDDRNHHHHHRREYHDRDHKSHRHGHRDRRGGEDDTRDKSRSTTTGDKNERRRDDDKSPISPRDRHGHQQGEHDNARSRSSRHYDSSSSRDSRRDRHRREDRRADRGQGDSKDKHSRRDRRSGKDERSKSPERKRRRKHREHDDNERERKKDDRRHRHSQSHS